MGFQDGFLMELEHEAVGTRRALERIPADKFDWVPHARSMKLGALAGHIAQIPSWARTALTKDSLDVAAPEVVAARPAAPKTQAELIERWEKNYADMRAAVAGAAEGDFDKTFTLHAGEKTIFTLPRKAALRGFLMSHLIHHRGQLTVYLRLLDVPVPSIYGPSADEQ